MSTHSPYAHGPASVRTTMFRVLAALVPALAVLVWYTHGAILLPLALSTAACLALEAVCLKLRARAWQNDGSAMLTAWLLTLCLPVVTPWWLILATALIAIVFAKQLYGGLGQNPFNPAMAAFCMAIVAAPGIMAQHLPPHAMSALEQIRIILGLDSRELLDGIASATPLNALANALHHDGTHAANFADTLSPPLTLILAYALGGLWLIRARTIDWRTPLAFLGTLLLLAALAWWIAPARYPAPLFHLLHPSTMLAAFFILTDPVTGCTTARGKILLAACAALIVWLIRSHGAYPDGIAFSVLLMNFCAPFIDLHTQPRASGHER